METTTAAPPKSPNAFSWSVSRHDTFDSCARKYYFSYYASVDDPEIRRLKRLSALPLWAGNVVHETIEELLKTREAVPSETEQEALIRAVVHERMLGEWRESEAGPHAFRLFEHEYEQPVQQEDKKILVGTVMRSLRNFFRSDTLREAYAVGREQWLSVEDLVSFELEGVTVLLRMDLAYRGPGGRVRIVDWKTGRREGRFNEVQLAGYALFARECGWAADPTGIETELAYLMAPRYVTRRVDESKVKAARSFIKKSASRMQALLADPTANTAREEDFARVDRPSVCRRCNFRRLCYPRAAAQARPEVEAAAAGV